MERKLTDLLPERYLNSPEVGAAAGILWVLGEVFRARALDWLTQLCIDTATWGIVYWEREYGVTPQATDTLDDRRSRVKAKLRAPQTVTAAMLENLTDSYINGQSIVTELPRQHKVQIQFNGDYGVPANLESLTAALLEVLPSHVVYEYLYRYLLVREVHGMTINELQSHTLHDFAF
ncbi:putative phage tail protein [Agathobaculum sp. Marseille-P7918]|uniref:putative phage tail protein n=1 Tax=Agathobaculum sp. Marseille-P7918 TaxID=2479843 RepID=UPI0013DE35A8|nr:putative phage tail protein [Agathobaculum sp. Marseille-P7918]